MKSIAQAAFGIMAMLVLGAPQAFAQASYSNRLHTSSDAGDPQYLTPDEFQSDYMRETNEAVLKHLGLECDLEGTNWECEEQQADVCRDWKAFKACFEDGGDAIAMRYLFGAVDSSYDNAIEHGPLYHYHYRYVRSDPKWVVDNVQEELTCIGYSEDPGLSWPWYNDRYYCTAVCAKMYCLRPAESPLNGGPICEDAPRGAACWMAMSNQPDCHVWIDYWGNLTKSDPILQYDERMLSEWSATWTGPCSDGMANGEGVFTLIAEKFDIKPSVEFVEDHEGIRRFKGVLRDGKLYNGELLGWGWERGDDGVFYGTFGEEGKEILDGVLQPMRFP